VYAQLEQDFGMLAPPIAMHSAAPRTMAGAWMMLRESLVAAGTLDRAAKEAVAAEISAANSCPYCVDVHSTTFSALARGRENPEIKAWAGATGTRETAGRQDLPVTVEQTAELVGVVVTFHYLNRMVNVLLPDSPLPPGAPRGALPVLGRFMRSAARTAVQPGRSAGLLPATPLPADMGWATGNPAVARAFAGAAGTMTGAGYVPDAVRALLTNELDRWDGRPAGLSRDWADDAVAVLPTAERPAGRLALLTAIASYQVDDDCVSEFRRGQPDDRALVELCAWASLASARRVGDWIRISPNPGS
jgi:AhpD family alkylhydroperoxidase